MELVQIDYNHFKVINEELVATIGQFDGLHIAHLALINKTITIARNRNLKSAVFTFDPHPDFVLKKSIANTYVTPLEEKICQLEKLGIDYLILINFTVEIANMSPKDFVDKILLSNGVKEVIVGFDFSFGKEGKGKAANINLLSNNLIKTEIVDEIKYQNQKVGTTLIKTLLSLGKTKEVYELLGRFYKIIGRVVKGNQIGRTLNFPTANLKGSKEFAKIRPGVYVVRVIYNHNSYYGIANLGYNPSFNLADSMVFETHIFDFNEDIYGKKIEIELIDYIRSEKKFSSKELFLEQIEIDVQYAKTIIKQLD